MVDTMNTPVNLLPPRTLRVLFLNPPDPDGGVWMKEVGRCGRKSIGGEVWPQTGLASLAAMVEGEGHEARILDGMAEPMSLDELEREVHEWKPDLIVANSATPTFKNDALILDHLQMATAAICGFVGPHVSALPVEALQESTADFGLINEADETIAELVWAVSRLATLHSGEGDERTAEAIREVFENIKGLAWRVPGSHAALDDYDSPSEVEVVVNEPRPMIKNLDELLLPARHLLPNEKYRMPFFGEHPFATIIPSRGCPWPCTFCRAGRVWGRKIRVRSVESILEEIMQLRDDFDINHIVFMTDSLTLNRDWAKDLFRSLIKIEHPPEWICNSRVDVVDAEMLNLMAGAGCKMVSYGLESGSQEVLDRCKKGITLEQSEQAIALTREAGLLSMGYFVIGLPGETHDTVKETIRFAKRVNPDYVNFHIATPFPGTDLYDEAYENGWLLSEDWADYEEEGSAVMEAGELTADELEAAQRRAMRSFYLRPSRLWQELRRVDSWSEFIGKAKAGLRVFTTLRKR